VTKKTEKPEPQIDDSLNIREFLSLKLGMEPNAWGSKRRWHFLRTIARYVYEVKYIDFDSFFIWATAHCQCMKLRTLREDYLDTLERLELIRVDLNTGAICWKKGEVSHG
jgi:hypothetical protein